MVRNWTNWLANWRIRCRGNIKSMGEDMERNFKSLLQSTLARMDLVTREEFDVQLAVLARTREKLEALEARLAALEENATD